MQHEIVPSESNLASRTHTRVCSTSSRLTRLMGMFKKHTYKYLAALAACWCVAGFLHALVDLCLLVCVDGAGTHGRCAHQALHQSVSQSVIYSKRSLKASLFTTHHHTL